MKIYIRAMAIDKQNATKQISDVSGVLIEHLIKLYLYPNSEYENHWRKEIWNFFHSVPKLKTTKKFPQYKLIREAIGVYDDMIPELSYAVQDEYSSLNVERNDLKECEELVINYLDWASDKLSRSGVLNPTEVYTKLDELGL